MNFALFYLYYPIIFENDCNSSKSRFKAEIRLEFRDKNNSRGAILGIHERIIKWQPF